jgi:formate dehydrogenase subunit beta
MGMTKALVLNKNAEESAKSLLTTLLKKGKIAAVFTLKRINAKGAIAYSLITDPKDLEYAVPFYPFMPVQAGKLLSRLTLKGASKKPVAVIVKPCELRGFIELIKREQGSLENLIVISSTCGGVYPSKMNIDGGITTDLISVYWAAVKEGEIPADIRPACRSCVEFIPYEADITVDLIGNTNLADQSIWVINTEKGIELLKGLDNTLTEKKLDQKMLQTHTLKRDDERKLLFKAIDAQMNGIDDLEKIFGKCIGCHGCSKVCPICYCTLCEFESPDAEYSPAHYDAELKRRGGMKVPPGTIYFHLGRLTHIGISCVGCGCCEDVCPVEIPVSMIFKKVGESIQDLFDYIPGKNIEEKLPLVTFEKEEFAEIEL